jgi:hypothetical protein
MSGKRRVKEEEQSITTERHMPLKNVASLMGEGEKFCRDQLFVKAIMCYTEVNIFLF